MKSLRARVKACFDVRSAAAITLLWCAALGQATPDVTVPEPGVLPLIAAGLVALLLVRNKNK